MGSEEALLFCPKKAVLNKDPDPFYEKLFSFTYWEAISDPDVFYNFFSVDFWLFIPKREGPGIWLVFLENNPPCWSLMSGFLSPIGWDYLLEFYKLFELVLAYYLLVPENNDPENKDLLSMGVDFSGSFFCC